MKLLTQEEGSKLKVGDVVNLYWFSPRKDKNNPNSPSREWEGRTEYVSIVWRNRVVTKDAWLSTNDGYAVKLDDDNRMYLTSSMELVE